MITAILARRRILLAKQSGMASDMVLLINSPNTGDFSVTTSYGTFTAVKVSDYPYLGTTVTHKLSISNVTFSAGKVISGNSTVRGLFVGVESWGTSNTYITTQALFNSCTKLRGIPSSWEGLGELTNATEMFWGCTSLTSIPDSWEGLGELTTALGMFSRCNSLTNCGTIFTGLAWATNVNSLFYRCTGMQGDIYTLYVYLSTKPITVSSYSYCFGSCTQAVGYSSIPITWKQ